MRWASHGKARLSKPPDTSCDLPGQFNRDFRFTDAVEVIPYLRELGITDLYASPYFAARPGSLHGYDITDPTRINPEIGTREDYDIFVTTCGSALWDRSSTSFPITCASTERTGTGWIFLRRTDRPPRTAASSTSTGTRSRGGAAWQDPPALSWRPVRRRSGGQADTAGIQGRLILHPPLRDRAASSSGAIQRHPLLRDRSPRGEDRRNGRLRRTALLSIITSAGKLLRTSKRTRKGQPSGPARRDREETAERSLSKRWGHTGLRGQEHRGLQWQRG